MRPGSASRSWKGGNATDAAVAVAFALAVTWPEAGNLGGGGFWISRDARGNVLAVDFREMAPRAARRDLYTAPRAGGAPPSSTEGPLASGVPGSVAGSRPRAPPGRAAAVEDRRRAGRPARARRLRDDRGRFRVDRRRAEARSPPDPETARIFLPGGAPPAPGAVFRQPDLARTLEAIRDRGEDGFYRGRVARAIEDGQKRAGGLITRGDLARYEAKVRKPVRFRFQGVEVVTTPAPSSGPVLAEMAIMAELVGADTHPTARRRVGPLARRDREARVPRPQSLPGRPGFRARSTRSSSPTRRGCRRWSRPRSTRDRATPTRTCRRSRARSRRRRTSRSSTTTGMAVSVTTTLNDSFGNARVAPGLGFLWNNEMDDFATRPGQPNLYGLVQGEVNAVAPGKRMLSSMCPSIAVAGGRAVLVWGTPGGSTIPTTNLQVLLESPPARRAARGRRRRAALPPAGPARRDPDRAGPLRRRPGSRRFEKMGHDDHASAARSDASTRSRSTPDGTLTGGRRPARRRRGARRPGDPVTAAGGDAMTSAARSTATATILRPPRSAAASGSRGLAVAPRRRRRSRSRSATWPCAARPRSASPRRTAPRSRCAAARSTPPAERFADGPAPARRDAADRRQPLRGARAHGAALSPRVAGAYARARSRTALIAEADAIAAEDIAACRRIGRFGAELLTGETRGPDALQRRRPRDGRLRNGARRRSAAPSRPARRSASSPARRGPSSRARG